MALKTAEVKMWENPEIHLGLLNDERRNKAYRSAIQQQVKKGSRVLDIGSGIGILTFFSVLAGAKKVTSVEWSDMIHVAKRIADQNGFSKNIEFIKEDILKAKLIGKFDVITHELIGGMLWDENMLKIVKRTREKHLRKNGVLIPWKIDLFLAPISHRTAGNDNFKGEFYKYNIDFSPIKVLIDDLKSIENQPTVEFIANDKGFLADSTLVDTIDFYETDGTIPKSISTTFTVNRTGSWNAMVGYFDIWLDESYCISNYPQTTNTNWGQFVIPLGNSYTIKKGQKFKFTLFPKRFRSQWEFEFECLQ